MAGFLFCLGMNSTQAALVATSYPVGLKKTSETLQLAWTGGSGRVHLRASTQPGGRQGVYDSLHLPSQVSDGSYGFRIDTDIPSAYRSTDLRFGANYCVWSDGSKQSQEFVLLIESNQAPIGKSPANAAPLQDPTPLFSWTGQAPYYTVLVSDEPFKISDSGTVTGISATWQLLTPYTSARYGEADPSGLSGIQAPPLIAGKTYNWLVLNNYTGTSAGTSKVASTPQSFTYSPLTSLSPPPLLTPKNGDTLKAVDVVDFSWNPVQGAASYKVELLEENLISGSQADLVIWKTAVTSERARLSGATALLRRYRYKWRVYAIDNQGSASLSEKWNFFYAIDVASLQVRLQSKTGAPIAYAPVRLSRIGSASSSVYQSGSSDATGILDIAGAVLGTYEVRCENVTGYLPQIDTVRHVGPGATSAIIALRPASGRIVGRITSSLGQGLQAAKIIATASDGVLTTAQSNSQGDYQLSLALGTYSLAISATGYAPANRSVTLGSATPEATVSAALAAQPFAFNVSVLNGYTQKPLLGAKVSITQAGVITDAYTDGQGSARFLASAGSISVLATMPGFSAANPTVLTLSGDKALNLALDPGASLVSGRVRNPQKTALAQATVRAIPSKGLAVNAITDNQGYYEMSLGAGNWVLEAAKSGFTSTHRISFSLESGRTLQDMDLGLQPNPCLLAGRVTLSGAGLSGVTLASGAAATLSDGGGYFRLAVAEGQQTVTASKTGYLFSSPIAVNLGTGDSAVGLAFSASANAGGVSGQTLSLGQVVAQATVKISSGLGAQPSLATALDGKFNGALQPGSYRLWAEKQGFLAADTISLQVQAGVTSGGLSLNLIPYGAKVGGQVRNGTQGLASCLVQFAAQPAGTPNGQSQSDVSGNYALQVPPNTPIRISVSCDGYQITSQTQAGLANGQDQNLNFDLAVAAARVKGQLVDSKGAALSEVNVEAANGVAQAQTKSSIDGLYQLDLGTGNWTLKFSKTGYAGKSRLLTVVSGQVPSLKDSLPAAVGRLTTKITDGNLGLSNASIQLIPQDGGTAKNLNADADGRADFGLISAGSYQLAANKPGYVAKSQSFTMAADGVIQVSLALALSSAKVSGSVTASAKPFSGATVLLSGSGLNRFTVSGADGSFVVDSLPAGLYRVSAYAEGYASGIVVDSLRLGIGEIRSSLGLTVVALTAGLQGKLLGADNPAGFTLALQGKLGLRRSMILGADGLYQFPALPADKYTVTALEPGWNVLGDIGKAGVDVDRFTNLDITVAAARYTLTGTLKDQGGNGLAAAPVMARGGTWSSQIMTNAQGLFTFADAPAGLAVSVGCVTQARLRECYDTAITASTIPGMTVKTDLLGLDRRGMLSGSVLQNGKALAGVSIRVNGGKNDQTVFSAGDGKWQMTGLAFGGSLRVTQEATGYGRKDTVFSPAIAASLSLPATELQAIRKKVEVRLRNTQGKALANAGVVMQLGNATDTVKTNAEGLAEFANRPAYAQGSLRPLLSAEEYEVTSLSFRMGENDTQVTLAVVAHRSQITVQVRDQAAKNLDDAQIWLDGKSQGLTRNGALSMGRLPAGIYRVSASKGGYQGEESSALSLTGDTSATVALTLTTLSEGLTGLVYDSVVNAKGAWQKRPMAGLSLRVQSAQGIKTLRADASGRYATGSLPSGNVTLTVNAPGHAGLSLHVAYTSGLQNQDVNLEAVRGTLSGRLLGGERGEVKAFSSEGEVLGVAEAGSDGWFALTGFKANQEVFLSALSREDSALASAPVSIPGQADKALGLDLILMRGGRMQVTVAASGQGRALAGAALGLWQSQKLLAMTQSDAFGQGYFGGLPPGSYDLIADLPGFGPDTTVNWSIRDANEKLTATARLKSEGAMVGGRVTDAKGFGLAASVILSREGGRSEATRADAQGRFQFASPQAGRYALTAAFPGFTAVSSPLFDYAGGEGIFKPLTLMGSLDSLVVQALDAETQAPIAGLLWKLETESGTDSAVSDSLGLASLSWSQRLEGRLSSVSEDYVAIAGLAVRRDSVAAGLMAFSLSPDTRMDGSVQVTVRDQGLPVAGAVVEVAALTGQESPLLSITGDAANLFTGLREPAEYRVTIRRTGFAELKRVVSLTRQAKNAQVNFAFPNSRLRVQVTRDGRAAFSAAVSVNGEALQESDTAGLYALNRRLGASSHTVQVQGGEALRLNPEVLTLSVGEDTVRTDTVSLAFTASPLGDTALESDIPLQVLRLDSLEFHESDACTLFVRAANEAWQKVGLKNGRKQFSGVWIPRGTIGAYEAYYRVFKHDGLKTGIESKGARSNSRLDLILSNRHAPMAFHLRDPRVLHAIKLLPASAETDTLRYDWKSGDVFAVQLFGEGGLALDAFADQLFRKPDTARPLQVTWRFLDTAQARQAGLTLTPSDSTPRLCHFQASGKNTASALGLEVAVKLGAVTLRQTWFVRVEDLAPVALGIRYAKEGIDLSEGGAPLILSNQAPQGYRFEAFARTAEGKRYRIRPKWSLGADSAAGILDQNGLFLPASGVARDAKLLVTDTLLSAEGRQVFTAAGALLTQARLIPADTGVARLGDGEGLELAFPLNGLAKAFTVSIARPQVNPLLRASPSQEVVGDVHEIELSESQPFKSDSGAVLRLPVAEGLARMRKVYVGHWNSSRLQWERIDSAEAATVAVARVFGFSKYAVIMGSLPLGAYELSVAPNPFSPLDPWGLQLHYTLSSEVSSQVGVRIEVYNLVGDKVYSSREVLVSKGEEIMPGLRKANPTSPERREALGPYVWDGRDDRGVLCRNGRYLLRLIVRDGKGSKEYLRKVVLIQ